MVKDPAIRNPSPTIKEFVILLVGFSIVTAPETVRVNPELIVNEVIEVVPAHDKE
jgi:hypothetical protein